MEYACKKCFYSFHSFSLSNHCTRFSFLISNTEENFTHICSNTHQWYLVYISYIAYMYISNFYIYQCSRHIIYIDIKCNISSYFYYYKYISWIIPITSKTYLYIMDIFFLRLYMPPVWIKEREREREREWNIYYININVEFPGRSRGLIFDFWFNLIFCMAFCLFFFPAFLATSFYLLFLAQFARHS